jgi:hypothetical protein
MKLGATGNGGGAIRVVQLLPLDNAPMDVDQEEGAASAGAAPAAAAAAAGSNVYASGSAPVSPPADVSNFLRTRYDDLPKLARRSARSSAWQLRPLYLVFAGRHVAPSKPVAAPADFERICWHHGAADTVAESMGWTHATHFEHFTYADGYLNYIDPSTDGGKTFPSAAVTEARIGQPFWAGAFHMDVNGVQVPAFRVAIRMEPAFLTGGKPPPLSTAQLDAAWNSVTAFMCPRLMVLADKNPVRWRTDMRALVDGFIIRHVRISTPPVPADFELVSHHRGGMTETERALGADAMSVYASGVDRARNLIDPSTDGGKTFPSASAFDRAVGRPFWAGSTTKKLGGVAVGVFRICVLCEMGASEVPTADDRATVWNAVMDFVIPRLQVLPSPPTVRWRLETAPPPFMQLFDAFQVVRVRVSSPPVASDFAYLLHRRGTQSIVGSALGTSGQNLFKFISAAGQSVNLIDPSTDGGKTFPSASAFDRPIGRPLWAGAFTVSLKGGGTAAVARVLVRQAPDALPVASAEEVAAAWTGVVNFLLARLGPLPKTKPWKKAQTVPAALLHGVVPR